MGSPIPDSSCFFSTHRRVPTATMMGLNPFDAMMGFGHPYHNGDVRTRHVRAPPRRAPPRHDYMQQACAPSTDEVPPNIDLSEKADIYRVHLSAPNRTRLVDSRVSLLDDGTLLFEGDLLKEGPKLFTYVTRCRCGVYEEPNEQALISVLPSGQYVTGGAPTRAGWIALDDDESWMLDDGSLALVQRPSPAHHRHPFAKRVSLPADAELNRAQSQPDGSGGLVVTVPRRIARSERSARHVPIHVQRPTGSQPAAAKKSPAAAASRTVDSQPKKAPAPSPPPKAGAGNESAETYKEAHKRKAAERRGLAEELAALQGNEYTGPVLSEVTASSRNVQSPTEFVEEWVATSDGGFVRGDDRNARPATKREFVPARGDAEEENELAFWGF